MITSKVRKRLPIPNEPNDWIEIRSLSGPALDEAERVVQRLQVEMANLAGEGLMEQIKKAREESVIAVVVDPLQTYDAETVLRKGLVAWSYSERCTVENISEIDRAMQRWAALEIIKLTEETEDERKSKAS
jgi:hypothetical protein